MPGAVIFVFLAACHGASDDGVGTADTGPVLVELSNRGTACLVDRSFPGDAPFDVRVVLDDCASGCASEVEASCEVRLVTGEIVVTASGGYRVPSGHPDCPAMCVEVAATCAGESLPAGYWALDYGGGHSDGFVVPGTAEALCATAP